MGTLEALYWMMKGGVVPAQSAQHHLIDGGHLGHGVADIHVRLEEELDDAGAVERLRLDVLDVVDCRGHDPLAGSHDAAGHLLRREASVAPDHRHNGNVDVRKDVRGIVSMLKTPRIRIKSANTTKV